MKRSRLRTYAPMAKRSEKAREAEPDFRAVYAEVDARSGGRCEVTTQEPGSVSAFRCHLRAQEHHHLFKPRRAHHTAHEIIHICRGHHDRVEWPFTRGRLCYVGSATTGDIVAFHFALRYAASKFDAR